MFNFLRRRKTKKVITLDFTEVVLKEKQKEKNRKKKLFFNLFALGLGLSFVIMPAKSGKSDEFSNGVSSSPGIKREKVEAKVEECFRALDDVVGLLRTKINTEYDSLSEEDKEKIKRYISLFFGSFADREKTKVCREEVLKSMQIPFRMKDWGGFLYQAMDPTKKLSSEKFKLLLFKDASRPSILGTLELSYDNDMIAPIIKKYFNGTFEVLLFWFSMIDDRRSVDFDGLERREDLKFCFASFVLHPKRFVTGLPLPSNKYYEYANKIICPFTHLEKDFTPLLGEEEILKRTKPLSEEQINRIYHKRFYEVLRQTILWLDKEFGKKGRGLI